ncbi:hypothetical protein P3T35_006190 [Kitasatospora sp. GP30]|uniref:hypothetical protein n=1 Tax=Kitasatospora sp. GP30 TaxID=3035084 RepID=UPI000CB6E03D|nr:hypothetical protein [Kitasatospora sp. GP30]MDH6144153.1 hypothetical protein [Kitasatospora sp. GP30]
MYRRPVPVLLVLSAATVLAGCSSSHSAVPSTTTQAGTVSDAPAGGTSGAASSPVQVPGTVGFLNTDSGTVSYLQWQADGRGEFSGTALQAAANGTPPDETVKPATSPISGQVNGSAVTLDIADRTDQGVLTGGNLTVNVIQQDGSIRSITYHQASATDYNTALSQLQQTVSSADAQEKQQQSQASLQTSAQQALSTLQADNNAFTNAKAVRADLDKANSDLQQERRDIGNGNGDNCYNIQVTVDYDASTNVGYDVTTAASYDVGREQSALTSARSDIQAVQRAEAALNTAGLPATPGASDAITTAQQHDTEAVTTTNSAIDSLNSDLATAYSIAKSAGTGSCAGDGPGSPPAGLSHIS